MTRRENHKVTHTGEDISPPIHTSTDMNPEFTYRSEHMRELQTGDIQSNIDGFVGASLGGIEAFQSIIPHVSLFYGLYLRTVTNSDELIRATSTAKSLEPDFNDNTIYTNEIHEGDDVRGRTPKIGRWEPDGGGTFVHADRGRDFSKEVPLITPDPENNPELVGYYQMWLKFRDEISQQMNIGKGDARQLLREKGMGELQVWLCWRYFTGRTLDWKTWQHDLPNIIPSLANNGDEEHNDWAERVWNELGGNYAFVSGTPDILSAPVRNRACAFSLGCPQNLPLEQSKFANRLSWELEHSRPQSWGGSFHDEQPMCTHHNRIKSDLFLFDTHTFLRIFTIHLDPINRD